MSPARVRLAFGLLLLTLASAGCMRVGRRGVSASAPVPTSMVSDTVRVADQVRILALDSAGAVIGEVPVYDFGYRGRGFLMLKDGRVHLRREGTVRFTARLQARHWSGRESARPSVQVALVVH